jgi:hypothetical protein
MLKSQPQRMRRDWKILFHLLYTMRLGRIVENRDTGKFGNRFFKAAPAAYRLGLWKEWLDR